MEEQVKAVFFDAVGTIMRPWPSVGSVYSAVAREQGLFCPPGRLNRQFRKAYRELMPERFTGRGDFRTSEGRETAWWKRAAARTFERAGCPSPSRAVTDGAFAAFGSGSSWWLYADASRTFRLLRKRGLRLGIISNYDSRLMTVLADLGLKGYFDTVVISSLCGHAKPSTHIFRRALRELSLEPHQALHVGDRREEDYRAPRRAGLKALWLVRKKGAGGATALRSLDQLPSRLNRMF